MSQRKVNIWKHFLGNFYVEISNGYFSGNLLLINFKENSRKVSHISKHGSSSFWGKDFFDDCTFVTKTTVSYPETHEYPWHEHESIAWKALEKIYGENPVIPKKIPRVIKEKPFPIQT